MTILQKDRNENIMERWKNHGKIEVGRVFVLADMARRGEYPDGSFSDDECNIWSEFLNVAELYEGELRDFYEGLLKEKDLA